MRTLPSLLANYDNEADAVNDLVATVDAGAKVWVSGFNKMIDAL